MGWREIESHQIRKIYFFKKLRCHINRDDRSRSGWPPLVYNLNNESAVIDTSYLFSVGNLPWNIVDSDYRNTRKMSPPPPLAGSVYVCSWNRRFFCPLFRLEDCENHIKTLQFVSTRTGRCLFDNLSPELNIRQTCKEELWDVDLRNMTTFHLGWFGLFVHQFSHICNIGHVNYRLQFTTQLIMYNAGGKEC
jgi:hypothetical protein